MVSVHLQHEADAILARYMLSSSVRPSVCPSIRLSQATFCIIVHILETDGFRYFKFVRWIDRRKYSAT